MNRLSPLSRAFAALFGVVVFGLLGLWQVAWSWTALPSWYWGPALLFGLIVMTALSLARSTGPHLPFTSRVLRLGAGWGLSFLCYTLSVGALNDNLSVTNVLILISAAAVMTCIYGTIGVFRQRRTSTRT